MITPQELVQSFKKISTEWQELQKKKSEINIQINSLKDKELKEVYSKITVKQMKTIWNKSNTSQRFDILDSLPEFDYHFDKLDSHGGLRSGELMDQVINEKWNKSEWIDDMDSFFESYCKMEPKVLKFSKVWDNLSEKEKIEKLKDCNAWGYQNHNAKAKWSELTKHVQTLVLVYEGILE